MKILKVPYVNTTYKINKILEVQLDDDIYEEIKDNTVYVSARNNERTHYYFRIGGKGFYRFSGGAMGGGRYTYLHRYVIDCPEGMVADHIDGNTLNCTRANLRALPPRLNKVNQRAYLNYGLIKQRNGKYKIKLYKDDMALTLNNIDSYDEAISIRLKLRKLLHGI